MKMEFQIGDRVRIRQWDDMEAEFGLDDCGDIPCHLVFTPGMRELCGEEFTIIDIGQYDDNQYFLDGETFCSWNISGDMLEYAGDPEEPELLSLPPDFCEGFFQFISG